MRFQMNSFMLLHFKTQTTYVWPGWNRDVKVGILFFKSLCVSFRFTIKCGRSYFNIISFRKIIDLFIRSAQVSKESRISIWPVSWSFTLLLTKPWTFPHSFDTYISEHDNSNDKKALLFKVCSPNPLSCHQPETNWCSSLLWVAISMKLFLTGKSTCRKHREVDLSAKLSFNYKHSGRRWARNIKSSRTVEKTATDYPWAETGLSGLYEGLPMTVRTV